MGSRSSGSSTSGLHTSIHTSQGGLRLPNYSGPYRNTRGACAYQTTRVLTATHEAFSQMLAGGTGGWGFDTGMNLSGVRSIDVWCGKYLASFQIKFRDGTTSQHVGGKGGTPNTFPVPEGESITRIEVWSDRLIHAIQFHTNRGTVSQKLGGEGGARQTLQAPPGQSLVGFFGKSGDLIDSIGADWALTRLMTDEPRLSLVLVFSCDGGSKGIKKVQYKRGTTKTTDSSITTSLASEIRSSVQAAYGSFSGSLTGELRGSVLTSLSSSIVESEEYMEVQEFDLSAPCFVYVPTVQADTVVGNFIFRGGAMIRSKKLPDDVTDDVYQGPLRVR